MCGLSAHLSLCCAPSIATMGLQLITLTLSTVPNYDYDSDPNHDHNHDHSHHPDHNPDCDPDHGHDPNCLPNSLQLALLVLQLAVCPSLL